jgi:hypothetical protein
VFDGTDFDIKFDYILPTWKYVFRSVFVSTSYLSRKEMGAKLKRGYGTCDRGMKCFNFFFLLTK